MPAEAAKVVMDASSVTTIINNLNTSYSTAMGEVITYTAIIIGLVGILIPGLSILFQWRSLKAEKVSLENFIQVGIENAKLSIRNDLIKEMNEQISIEKNALMSNMEGKLDAMDKKFRIANASIFFLQRKSHLVSKEYIRAIEDYCIAAKDFILGESEINGQAALMNIVEACLPQINKTSYEDEEVDGMINPLIQFLESDEINVNDRYTLKARELKAEIKKVKARVPA